MRILLSQIKALTLANLKTRYRGTVSGFLWVLLNPILLYGAQSYAFNYILKLQVDHYPLFLLSGLLPWIFMSQSLDMCTPVFVNSGRLMKSLTISPVVFMLAQIIDNLINFCAAFLVLLIPIAWSHSLNFKNLFFLPIPILILFIAVVSMSWILATLNVFYRDLKFIVSFAITVAFYLTPIFYPESLVDEKYRWVIKYNIFAHLIAPFREITINPLSSIFMTKSFLALGISLVLLAFAVIIWKRKRNALYHYL